MMIDFNRTAQPYNYCFQAKNFATKISKENLLKLAQSRPKEIKDIYISSLKYYKKEISSNDLLKTLSRAYNNLHINKEPLKLAEADFFVDMSLSTGNFNSKFAYDRHLKKIISGFFNNLLE